MFKDRQSRCAEMLILELSNITHEQIDLAALPELGIIQVISIPIAVRPTWKSSISPLGHFCCSSVLP